MTRPKNAQWGFGGIPTPEQSALDAKIEKWRRVQITRWLADAYTTADIIAMLPAALHKQFPESYPVPKEASNV